MAEKSRPKNWTRDELIVAFNLYCKIPFSKIDRGNKSVQELAGLIGRSADAVALKLANFGTFDAELKANNLAGSRQPSKADRAIWDEFSSNREEMVYQSEILLSGLTGQPLEKQMNISEDELPTEGKEREALIKTRVNQWFFRQTVLSSFEYRCCITGIAVPELLNAGHIVPWAVDRENRMNPSNGLCLNALHDRAFDRGLITVTPDYRVKISEALKKKNTRSDNIFDQYDNKPLIMPQRFVPRRDFLEYHNEHIFIK